jgi:hypothetical protein
MITRRFFLETVGSREHTTPAPDQIEAARLDIRARRARLEVRVSQLTVMAQELASVPIQLIPKETL